MNPRREKPHADRLTKSSVDSGFLESDSSLSREEFLRLSRDYLSVFKKSLIDMGMTVYQTGQGITVLAVNNFGSC